MLPAQRTVGAGKRSTNHEGNHPEGQMSAITLMNRTRPRRRTLAKFGLVGAALCTSILMSAQNAFADINYEHLNGISNVDTDNNARRFTVSAGSCSVTADFRVIPLNAPGDTTLFLDVAGNGPISCFNGYKIQLNLDLYDWSQPNDPWTQSYHVNVTSSGPQSVLLGPLSDNYPYEQGLTLEKMQIWVQNADNEPQAASAITVPYDTRMCDPTPDHPFGGPTVDCGYVPTPYF
jgi:hypothetical protein